MFQIFDQLQKKYEVKKSKNKQFHWSTRQKYEKMGMYVYLIYTYKSLY